MALTRDNALDVMKSVLDSKYIEHDTFALFSSLMSRAKPWYEFSEEATPSRKAKVCFPGTGGEYCLYMLLNATCQWLTSAAYSPS